MDIGRAGNRIGDAASDGGGDGGLTIRAITPADHDAWLPLWRGYQEFYRVDLSQDATATAWARLNEPSEPMHAALAWSAGNRAVGLVHWLTHRSTWTIGDYCYLQDLFVASEARKGGVGGRLIEHVMRDAAARECSRVYWLTHESNRDAMRLYDRVGDRSGFIQYRKILS